MTRIYFSPFKIRYSKIKTSFIINYLFKISSGNLFKNITFTYKYKYHTFKYYDHIYLRI